MKTFNVQVARTSTRRMWIEVDAESALDAQQKAMDVAGDQDFMEFGESEPDYRVEDVDYKDDVEEENPFKL